MKYYSFLHQFTVGNKLWFYCNITSKINVTPKGVYLPISKLHSILAVANLLAHNNKSQICYCSQILLQSAAVTYSFSDTFGGYHLFCWRWYTPRHLLSLLPLPRNGRPAASPQGLLGPSEGRQLQVFSQQDYLSIAFAWQLHLKKKCLFPNTREFYIIFW